MTNVRDLYLNWLMNIVIDEEHQYCESIFDILFDREFYWTINMDENRAEDGIHLRKVFEDQTGHMYEDDGPCNMLEMMVALAVRGSEDILWDGENNWTPFLFWSMVDNLDILECSSIEDINEKITRFLDRNYEKNGSGSLFVLSHFPKNFQKLEIWYQMQYWISENFL